MKKEKTEPINVRSSLKDFLEAQKQVFKKKEGKFIGIPEILMYYLRNSDEFIRDYSKFTGKDESGKDEKIFSYFGEDLLLLLVKE
jgi:hypothetical protein